MMVSATDTVVSRDGTRIAFQRTGMGRPVILVDAALCRRGFGPSGDLAELLAPQFAVITYDRRGRGASGDTPPYAVEREIEDLAALIDKAGGTASLVGTSSGAVLALEASNRLSGVRKLALYEPPLILDSSHPSTEQHWARIGAALAAQDRGAAVDEFLRMVGVPTLFIRLMHVMPTWSKLRAMAHTLLYDGILLEGLQRGQPLLVNRWPSVTAPTLVITGSRSADWMKSGNRTLSLSLPNSQNQLLKGQRHSVKPKALAPVLAAFLEGGDGFD
jgi:pimeloyl-ACP methyl ester carboxylesterase